MGAAWRGDNALIKYLVSKGARLDARNARGWSATDMANGPFIRGSQVPVKYPQSIALLKQTRRPGSPRRSRTRGSAAASTAGHAQAEASADADDHAVPVIAEARPSRCTPPVCER